ADAQAKIDAAILQIDSLAATDIDGRRLLDGSADFQISGRDTSQVTGVTVHAKRSSGTQETTATIDGTVGQSATQAQLVYTGSGGNPAFDATFTLTGSLGSTSISTVTTDTLDELATEINNDSYKTGVTASVSGDEVTLTSVGYGSDALVSVVVTTGTFDTSGDDENGAATGNSGTAEINGHEYRDNTAAELRHQEAGATFAAGAVIRVTGHLGSDDITIIGGDTLVQIAGDIADSSDSTGITATVEGNQLVITSTRRGADAQATIEVLGGTFDTVSGATTTSGEDATVGFGSVNGNRFSVSQQGLHFEVEFAAGFTGDFNTMSIGDGALSFALTTDVARTSTIGISGVHASQLGGLSGTLDQIYSGGAYADLGDNRAQAIRIVDEALGDLTRIEGAVDGFYDAAITSASAILGDLQEDLGNAIDAIDLVDETEEAAYVTYYQGLAYNAVAGLAIFNTQRSTILLLIQQIAGLA
ncbi:MAG: hypothetical protein HQ581_25760, partial [Planctomycetes bacterium]|nr:hypothetical protein [Planctomycetota bacterium]